MFNPIIETAIGLLFVYLLLSMICSAVQEWIAALFALRAKTLFEGITKMLCGDSNLRDEIFNHPLIDGLSRKTFWDVLFRRSARPSYISAETFAKAFLSAANVTNATVTPSQPGSATAVAPTTAKNNHPLHANTQQLLQSFFDVAPGDINVLRKSVEGWYNDAMDRVSGWYKRKTQLVILIIGFLLALFFNADTFMLARALWKDPVLRANAANAAAEFIKRSNARQAGALPDNPNGPTPAVQPKPTGPKTQTAGTPQPSSAGTDAGTKTDIADFYPSVTLEGTEPSPPVELQYSAEQQQRAEQEYRESKAKVKGTIAEVTSELEKIKLPLGWCKGSATYSATSTCDADHVFLPHGGSTILLKICGLLVTMVALSQGTPFWFDLLKKVVNLRLAGNAPDEKKK
jgi:hypothetical protein